MIKYTRTGVFMRGTKKSFRVGGVTMGFITDIINGFKSADGVSKLTVILVALVALLVLFVWFAILSNNGLQKKICKLLKQQDKDTKRNTIEAYIRAVRPKAGNPLEGIIPDAPIEEPAPAVVAEPVPEEVVATVAPVPEVVEEPVEEVVPEVVEEPIEEPVEEVVPEVVEEPVPEVEEVVEEPIKEPAPIEEEPIEEVVEEPAPIVEEVVEEPIEETVEEPIEEVQEDGETGDFAEITTLLIPKKSHAEKYEELNKTNKRYYDSIMAYAEKLEGCHRQPSANADSVFYGRTCIVKTQIKQGKVVCNFSMIDASMKRMLKGEKAGGVKEKFTSVRVTSTDSLHIARQSVDFAYKMAIEEKEFKHQQQLQKRRDARKAKKEAAENE